MIDFSKLHSSKLFPVSQNVMDQLMPREDSIVDKKTRPVFVKKKQHLHQFRIFQEKELYQTKQTPLNRFSMRSMVQVKKNSK